MNRHRYRRRSRVVSAETARRRRFWFTGRLFVIGAPSESVHYSAPGDPGVFRSAYTMTIEEWVSLPREAWPG